MANDNQGVLLSRGSVRRIKRVVDRFEGVAPPPAFGGGGLAQAWNPGVQRARVTVAIPSGTWDSPSSSGKVRMRVKDAAGAWVNGDEVQVFNDNPMPAPLPVNRVCKIAWIAGEWWLDSAACSN